MSSRALVLCLGTDLLSEVAAGLADGGANVLLAGDVRRPLEDVDQIIGDASSRAGLDALVDAAVQRLGLPDVTVLSIVPQEAVRVAPVAAMAPAALHACTVGALRTTMWALESLGRHLKPVGGGIVFVAPSLSLVGAPGLVALTTLLEGQRGLMKSVARQWGSTGVRLNWIAAAPRALSDVFAEAPLAAKPDAVSVALGRPVAPRTEIAPVIAFLASGAGRAFTGATLPLDGGEWMAP